MRRKPDLLYTLLLMVIVLCTQSFAQAAELLGILSDNQGRGLSNIYVRAWVSTGTDVLDFDTRTDESGGFSFSGDSGVWGLDVPLEQLNARGYFSVGSASFQLTNQTRIRLATRKLSFTHRIAGRLVDETGQPLAGYSLRAGINENAARFQTNVTTGADGSFEVAAVPALWDLCCLIPAPGTSQRVFPEHLVEVTEDNIETRTNLVALRNTATILVNTTNLRLWEIVASAETAGGPYRLVQPVPFGYASSSVSFGVFDGLWTLSVTNRPVYFGDRQATPPGPVTVAVTNGVVTVVLAATLYQNPTQMQRVRILTTSGSPVTNTHVSAVPIPSAQISFLFPYGPGMVQPGIYDLALEEGRWRIEASVYEGNSGAGIHVEHNILIASNAPPPELNLVFPEPGTASRILGTVHSSEGVGLPGQQVYLNMRNQGTNYSIQLVTDDSGAFAADCLPGRWTVDVYFGLCAVSPVVVVSNHDEWIDLESCAASIPAASAVSVDAQDEAGPFKPDALVSLVSGFDSVETNTASLPGPLHLRAGLWSASVSRDWQVGGADPYTLFPTLKWQLKQGITSTSLVLVSRQATSRIQGTFRDEQGRLLTSGNVSAWTSVHGTNYSFSTGIASGYFSINVFPGTWEVAASVTSFPSAGIPGAWAIPFFYGPGPASFYTTPPAKRVQVTSEMAHCDFLVTNLAEPPTVDLTIKVVRDTGEAVPGAFVFSTYLDTDYARLDGASQWGDTDADGLLKMAHVPRGKFLLSAYDPDWGQGDPVLLTPTISYDAHSPSNDVTLLLRAATTCLSATASNAITRPFADWLTAEAQADGTNYSSFALTDKAGHFCIPVFPGTWTVGESNSPSNDYGFQSVAQRKVQVPSAGTPDLVPFAPEPIVGDFREAQLRPPTLLPDGGLLLELRAPVSLYWRIERSEDLQEWTPIGIQAVANGLLTLRDQPSPSVHSTFYRATWVK